MKARSRQWIDCVRSLIASEVDRGWERLKRTPSTFTWRCLDYLDSLPFDRQASLLDAFAERAPSLLGVEPLGTQPQNHELGRFYAEVLQAPSRHVSARLLRGMLAAQRVDGPQGPFARLPDEIVERATALKPTNAAQIRKEVKRAFQQRFGASAINQGAGNWLYQGIHQGQPFSVLIDYGGMGDQLRYWVRISDASTGIDTRTLSYEMLLGVGIGHWDFITADTLPDAIGLLGDYIQDLALIPSQFAAWAQT